MLIKLSLLLSMVLYAFIVGQSFFYLLAFSRATKKMQAASYIESRKLIDRELQSSLSFVYYAAAAAIILLIAFSVVNPGGLVFITAIIALVALIADVILALKGNVPINKRINSWTETNYPLNWKLYRAKWFNLYHIRQVINIAGFVTLLCGIIFGL
jgi:uncharacterized membrane protein